MAEAFVFLVRAPPDAIVQIDERGERLDPIRATVLGRAPEVDMRVQRPMIGGRRNSRVEWSGSRWMYQHLGHAVPCFHNDSLVMPSHPGVRLSEGDVFGPMAASGEGEIGFLLVLEPDPARRASALLPELGSRLRAAYPTRAAQLLEYVGRWFATEVLPGPAALMRVLACALCRRFRRADGVVEVERHRGRFQVLADAHTRVGDPDADTWMRLCEDCLADPGATHRRAANADMARADLVRALGEDVSPEVERRFQAAQPRVVEAACRFCGENGRILAGEGGSVCVPCLGRASSIRHVRG